MKHNCWEHKGCGCEPGGHRTVQVGVCPAATTESAHGIHGGENAGRACWAVAGTLCGGVAQESLMAKLQHCVGCDFRMKVEAEHRDDLLTPREIAERLSAQP